MIAITVFATLASESFSQEIDRPNDSYMVLPGDVLEISVWGEEDLQGEVLVRPDGAFSFPLCGDIVARDKTVEDLKGKKPKNDEKKRAKHLATLEYVHASHLGSLDDKYAKTKELKPDVIVLGYDQKHFIEGLQQLLRKSLPRTVIIRIGAHEEGRFKSSLLRDDLFDEN